MVSSKPSKQRKQLYNAPKHKQRKNLTAPLSDDLANQYGIARIPVRVGDVVKVMRGEFAGHEGKVIAVKPENGRIAIEGLTRKKADGSEVPVWVHASKVMIIKLDLSDKWRKEAIERKAEARKKTLEALKRNASSPSSS
ncbi:MAG: 50S ribosomal protein L24 [Sulfolobales archaeon]|nr:50S ribosomal protein L24 [Sulfolobales archaeon]MCG2893592.1 50S ribosomal protein L24 [Sulfolobales archaeon]MCG2910865.1 50S ribosomal protein L24 [Sulfolobales archaeon]MCQ4343643.1 50S ribosomal protein L24 [Sulfolobales archaeon]